MIHPALSARMPWAQRVVVAFAAVIIALAVLTFFNGLGPFDAAVLGTSSSETWTYYSSLGFGLLGLAVLSVTRGFQQTAWLGVVVAAMGALTLVTQMLGIGQGVEAWFMNLFSAGDSDVNGSTPALVAVALMMAGGVIAWLVTSRHQSKRILCFALVGSLLGAVGLLTLLGYALKIPVASRWGSDASLPPSIAILLLLTGLMLLIMAWREHASRSKGAPTWLPVPVITLGGLLTLVFWAGLREREIVYLSTTGQIAINSFASAINLEFEQQSAALERIARRWSADDEAPVWEADAAIWRIDAPGAVSIARVARDGATTWYWPTAGNEGLIGFNQFSQPDRRRALEAAASDGKPVVSSSVNLAGHGRGFVIYAPIYRARILVGYIGAGFNYQDFFRSIDQRTKITIHHHCEISIGDQLVYDSIPGLEINVDHPLALASVFTLENRRLRIVMDPTASYLKENRRYLPEMSLAGGLGITLLLGLSLHLARTARAGQIEAETSNKLLRAENEERRRIETMLKVSDERLRLSLDATSISIFEWDIASGEIRHGTGLPSKFGLPPAETLSTPEAWKALVHPDDQPDFEAAFQLQRSGAQEFIDPEYRMRTVDGSWRWFYARAKTVAYNNSGEPSRIVGTLQDITSRKESEKALRHSQAAARKLSLVASLTDNLVIIGTPDGAIEWVNESFERVMEYRLNEIFGKKPLEFLAGTATDRVTLDRIKQAIARGEVLSTEVVNYSKSGRKYNLQLEIQPVRNEQGVLENFIAVEADITARVETENALRRAKSEADAASRAKSEFLASMSHEIRTPMNGVIGMTSLLLDTPLNHEQRDSVSTIRTSGEALLTIINDILDFSKIESGKLELDCQPFDLTSSIEETLDLFAMQAASRKIELVYDIDPAVSVLLVGDANRLRQILTNLVNNAIKFTPSGSVAIEVTQSSMIDIERPRHRTLTIAVSDTGIGIPEDRLDRLFRPFSQVDSSITRKYGGTGLGLAICQRLCSLMGGSIRVQSDVRKGSTFVVTLPFEVAGDIPPSLSPLPAELGKGPVLCVDNHPVTLRRLSAFFQKSGIETITANSTEKLAEILQGPTAPTALLIDLDLDPAADGTQPGSLLIGHKIPVLGLLPYIQAPIPEWTAGLTFTTISKPLRDFTLVRSLNTLFPSATAATTPGKETEPLNLANEFPLTVLLAEDNPVNQKVAIRFLERLGYKTDVVTNGSDAVKAAAARPYDLIFMDLQMPEMDGMQATRLIRQNAAGGPQPCIVALTANAMPSDRDRCLSVGMNGFIAKPVKLFEIVDFIRHHFGRNQTRES